MVMLAQHCGFAGCVFMAENENYRCEQGLVTVSSWDWKMMEVKECNSWDDQELHAAGFHLSLVAFLRFLFTLLNFPLKEGGSDSELTTRTWAHAGFLISAV